MIAGRYELSHEIGRGGMGAVWLAHDRVLGREVAVKRIGMMPGGAAPGGSTPDLERAEREARLAARLNHPHVVHVFDLVVDDEGQWLVMEYVEGRTLAATIREEGALSHGRAAELIGQVASALAAAHAEGIVHRDVKPSNILVSPGGEVKLSDFGIARAEADPSLTQTGLVTGSPAYLSPEVASGHMATPASDVWSLGATLHHALSGSPPYEVGENLMGALFKIVHEDPPRLADAGWLAPLLAATMTKDPERRWSMEQVRDFLLAGPTAAQPAPQDSTQVLAPPAPPPTATPVSTPVPSGTTTSSSPSPAAPPRRRRLVGPLLVAAAVVALLGVIAWLALTGDDGSTPTIDRPTASSPAGNGGGGGGDQSPSPSPEPATAEGMESFIGTYLSTAPSSPESTFEMLTPGFQQASGGLDGYTGYWSTISSATLVDATADPETLVIQYDVDYVRRDGSQVSDNVTLQLEYRNGEYLIADEA